MHVRACLLACACVSACVRDLLACACLTSECLSSQLQWVSGVIRHNTASDPEGQLEAIRVSWSGQGELPLFVP